MRLEEALAANQEFGRLDDDLIARLADVVHVDAFGPNYRFFEQGEHGEAGYLILDGEVVAARSNVGGTGELRRMAAGDFFGLLALTADLPHEVTCRSAGAGRVAVLERSDIEPLVSDAPELALALQWVLGAQIAADFRAVNDEVHRRLLGG